MRETHGNVAEMLEICKVPLSRPVSYHRLRPQGPNDPSFGPGPKEGTAPNPPGAGASRFSAAERPQFGIRPLKNSAKILIKLKSISCPIALPVMKAIEGICAKFVEVAAIFSTEVRSNTAYFSGICKAWVTDAASLPPFPPDRHPIAYWRTQYLEWNATCDPRHHLDLAAMAVLSVPCSEAAAERLFPALDWVLDPHRRRLSIDVLSNEMIIRMWQVYTNTLAGTPFVALEPTA
jgi:hypothetical protein